MVDLSITEPLAAAAAGGGAGGPQDAAAAAAAAAGGPAAGAGGAAAAAAAAAASGVATGQALTGNTYELGSGSLLVPLMKDEGGALRVQVRAGAAHHRRGPNMPRALTLSGLFWVLEPTNTPACTLLNVLTAGAAGGAAGRERRLAGGQHPTERERWGGFARAVAVAAAHVVMTCGCG